VPRATHSVVKVRGNKLAHAAVGRKEIERSTGTDREKSVHTRRNPPVSNTVHSVTPWLNAVPTIETFSMLSFPLLCMYTTRLVNCWLVVS
jgi:hypothetical protein